ncbi:MAG: 16S rRNA (cytosine(1402)-N(4))-methyltransferase RsmH [Alphaproteobacteria bacterium]|nr:16S rRNA (cytosine(1402)-N(4))-methyltransferase RsmH [Alphaproteobacteria bacterium]
MTAQHIPVLLDSVMDALGNIHGQTVVDATFGAGGYSRAFLDVGANVIAFDRDPHVESDARIMEKKYEGRFSFIAQPFSAMSELPDASCDAIVFDLGISSMQIDEPKRGFSFRGDGPLDMRMSGVGITAAEFIKKSTIAEIAQILRDYGDIRNAMHMATIIKTAVPDTTLKLRNLINNPRDVAPVFQALRIAVNDEMGQIRSALDSVPRLLRPGGRCICVTFHSIEDRFVKNIFRQWTTAPGDPRMPTVAQAPFIPNPAVAPSTDEIEKNQRARSARMRMVTKSC